MRGFLCAAGLNWVRHMNALDTITGNAMAEAAQYWCYKKIVVTIKTGQKTVQRVFPRPYVVIGRDPKCDLVLEDPDLRGHLLYLLSLIHI